MSLLCFLVLVFIQLLSYLPSVQADMKFSPQSSMSTLINIFFKLAFVVFFIGTNATIKDIIFIVIIPSKFDEIFTKPSNRCLRTFRLKRFTFNSLHYFSHTLKLFFNLKTLWCILLPSFQTFVFIFPFGLLPVRLWSDRSVLNCFNTSFMFSERGA